MKYYVRSKDEFEKKYENDYSDDNTKKHRKWADEFNYGITHFGISPNDLPNSKIAFDCLHSRLSTGRAILGFIRKYLDGYGYNLNNKFCDVIRTRIGDYYVECYETFKSLACMHGE
jgi:hypothetical protein